MILSGIKSDVMTFAEMKFFQEKWCKSELDFQLKWRNPGY